MKNYRILKNRIEDRKDIKFSENQFPVMIIYGPRRVGKSTLVKETFPDALYLDAEIEKNKELLNSRDPEKISNYVNSLLGEKTDKILIIDEFQSLEEPGLTAKIIYDHIPNLRLVVTGSSAMEIVNKATESLAGRYVKFIMFPLTIYEYLIQNKGYTEDIKNKTLDFSVKNISANKIANDFVLDEMMRTGLYPMSGQDEEYKQQYLKDLVESYILKDIFYLDLLKNTKTIFELLKLLSYQTGNIINLTEIGNTLKISRQTVSKYIEILKKTFIIFTLPTFRGNRRDTIGKSEKVYFYDLGIRNALINDFSPVRYRRDFGAIWENFVISEIKKINDYYALYNDMYFWRTKWDSEVDLVLNKDGKTKAIEIKVGNGSITSAFTNTFPDAEVKLVNRENFLDLVL